MYSTLSIRWFLWFWICFCSTAVVYAQEADQDSAEVDTAQFKNSFVALPLVFRSPETSWGFGAGAFYAFRPSHYSENTRPSQIQIGGAYTLLNQILSYLPFQIFTNENRYQILGELGYYRFIYDYYGIGNDKPIDFRELFTVRFPRVRLQAMIQFRDNQYWGLRYWMDNYAISETEPGGELSDGSIQGSNGGFLSGLGLVHTYDTRDKIFATHKGWFVETVLFHNGPMLGSDFDYTKFIIDARRFFKLKENHSIGVNVYLEFTGGDAPFNQLALMGGSKRMRGYYEGRYRDKHMAVVQGEYRFPLFWRFSGVIFGGFASVNNRPDFLEPGIWRWNVGPGIRLAIDPNERINIRLDYGFTKESSGLYLIVGEAF